MTELCEGPGGNPNQSCITGWNGVWEWERTWCGARNCLWIEPSAMPILSNVWAYWGKV